MSNAPSPDRRVARFEIQGRAKPHGDLLPRAGGQIGDDLTPRQREQQPWVAASLRAIAAPSRRWQAGFGEQHFASHVLTRYTCIQYDADVWSIQLKEDEMTDPPP